MIIETGQVAALIERARGTYNGEKMLSSAARRAGRLGPGPALAPETAAEILVRCGWTWSDVLTANS